MRIVCEEEQGKAKRVTVVVGKKQKAMSLPETESPTRGPHAPSLQPLSGVVGRTAIDSGHHVRKTMAFQATVGADRKGDYSPIEDEGHSGSARNVLLAGHAQGWAEAGCSLS